MQISYLGLDCLRITTGGVTVLIHPLTKSSGLSAGKSGADIIIADEKEESDLNRSSAFVVNNPGEYEVKGVFIYGHYLKKQKQVVYLIKADGVRLLFLGRLSSKDVYAADMDFLKLADVVAIPVGGKDVLTAQQAVDLVSEIEPRIVLPMVYQMDGLKTEYAPVENFLKAFGGKSESVDKLKLMKSDLPAEDVLTYVIAPSNN